MTESQKNAGRARPVGIFDVRRRIFPKNLPAAVFFD